MKKKVLIDFHHEALFESLRLLFEERLGYEIYRPIGLEWFKEGYWALSSDPKSAEQILGLGLQEEFGLLGPNERRSGDALRTQGMMLRYPNIKLGEMSPGIFKIKSSVYPDKIYKGITLQTFKSMKFDIVMPTIPQHIRTFNLLQKKFQPKAHVIFQMGNHWHLPWNEIKNILNSTRVIAPKEINQVHYKQEFDLNLFAFNPKHNERSMISIMNYALAPSTFFELEDGLSGWHTKFYGCGNRDQVVGPDMKSISDIFQKEMGWLWHVKKESDGFGHNIFGAAAVGRPVIVYAPYFKGATLEPLLEHGKTCIDLAKVSIPDAIKLIKEVDQDRYTEWSHNIHDRFKEIVDYNQDKENIKKFLERLI
jgi:hypothetical protein